MSLFLSDLDTFMTVHNNCNGRIMDQIVTSIMFADDLVLFSNTQKGFQHSLSVLEKYCSTWDLRVNANKSKVLISNTNPDLDCQFTMNNVLDIILTDNINNSWSSKECSVCVNDKDCQNRISNS